MKANNKQLTFKSLLQWYLILIGSFLMVSVVIWLCCVYVLRVFSISDFSTFANNQLSQGIYLYVIVGFVAQLIDGTLGMAYGVSSTSFLITTGVSPAVASASVHASEVFTTGISGLSHWRFRNVDKKLFIKLSIAGSVGAILGAYVLSSFDGDMIKPYITIYLLLMGIRIIFKVIKKKVQKKEFKYHSILGFIGGFVDASGGGGWGPVVTTTLIGTGKEPKLTIGSVNAAEFLVTIASSSIFTMMIGLTHWNIIIGMLLGGMLAAPLAAFLCHKINSRVAMVLVGLLIIGLSIRTLVKMWF
ncbi:MAG TPA: sulfite exporter TauE/SafE family protein [Bacteroidales bacterium]|jgi:uncharacterized membrane protein YfcA|nr:sulfite exporter TauE/SafE family protein [Bacteroidales bacterium]HOU98197.1 sulfite exporter TauE/SafE family protein [Bacteroidales bacterium]